MPRLPLLELEEARADPVAYRQKMVGRTMAPFKPGYFSALKDSVGRYHKLYKDRSRAKAYLVERLQAFRNDRRKVDMLTQFDWYTQEVIARQWPAFLVRSTIRLEMPSRIGTSLSCSGQVGRIDLVPAGGYAVWLFRAGGAGDWESELQMPLVQTTVAARLLHVPHSEVSVGVYCFADQQVLSRQFSEQEIQAAKDEFDKVLLAMGY